MRRRTVWEKMVRIAFVATVVVVVFWCYLGMLTDESRVGQPRHRFEVRHRPVQTLRSIGSDRTAESMYKSVQRAIHTAPLCIDDALLVILITSAPDHVVQRSAIRRTWCATAESARASLRSGSDVIDAVSRRFQCVFLVGATGNEVTERAVRAEMAAHRDIAKGTFVDSYRNLTSKVLAGFHWCSSNCTSRFVLKTDDDCFVNVAVLLRLLAVQPDDDLYVGKIAEDTRVIRNVDSPWAVSEHEYPPLYYPAYASGTGYVLSYSAMRKILTESRQLRAFPNEDAYVGVLADQARIVPTNSYRFTFVSDKWAVCNYRYLVVIHRVSADRQRVQLDMVRRSTTECRHQKFITTWD